MKVLKQILFFCILGGIIVAFGKVIIPKDENYDKYEIFNQLEKNSIDVCYIGTSNSDVAINPDIIDEAAGCSSFNYSVTGLRIEYLYYRLIDLLKTQKPDLLVIDTTTFIPIERDTIDLLLRWTFNPLPFSINKLKGINDFVYLEDRLHYLSSYSYHSRIFELKSEDWEKAFNLYDYQVESSDLKIGANGWRNLGTESMVREDDYFLTDLSTVTEERSITAEQKEYLDKILEITRENNMQILFITVPYKETQNFKAIENTKVNNYLRKNYTSDDIKFLDMNTMYKELGFDYKDMIDEGHVNIKGSEIVSNYLAGYISSNYNFD